MGSFHIYMGSESIKLRMLFVIASAFPNDPSCWPIINNFTLLNLWIHIKYDSISYVFSNALLMKFQRFVWFYAISVILHIVNIYTHKPNTQYKMDKPDKKF